MEIAPCYFVAGNHEARISEYDELKESLTEQGVVVLENQRIELEQSGGTIVLLGVNDPAFQNAFSRKICSLYKDYDTSNNVYTLLQNNY